MFAGLRIGYYSLLALVAFVLMFTGSLGVTPLSAYFAPGSLRVALPGWLFPGLLWFGFVAVELTKRRVNRPTLAFKRIVIRNRHWLMRGLLFVALVFPLGRTVGSYKNAIPTLVPFYADPYLIAADRSIFGLDPWRLTHAFIGPLGTVILDRAYAVWYLMMMLLIGWFCFTRNPKLQVRGLFAYLSCWFFLGNLLATALSSVGPCFYDAFYHSNYYQPLMQSLDETNRQYDIKALHAMNYLRGTLGEDKIGAGISAMPSMHVTIAFLFFLATATYARARWVKIVAGLYAVMIFVGSIHLGWHYAVDGIVAIASTIVIWIGAGRFVDWVEVYERRKVAAALAPAEEQVAGEGGARGAALQAMGGNASVPLHP